MAAIINDSPAVEDYKTPAEYFPGECSTSSSSSSKSTKKRHQLKQFLHRVLSHNNHDGQQLKSGRFKRNKNKSSMQPSTNANPANDVPTSTRQLRESKLDMLDETWEDWLSKYQTGNTNISEISRPACFGGFGYSAPPVHIHETKRLKELNNIKDPSIWKQHKQWISDQLKESMKDRKLKYASVSLVEQSHQQVVVAVGLSKRLRLISRDISIDAHTILSKDYFNLLDAGSDWRTKLSPLVHGPPFIKFYLGVPIIVNGMPVGTIAVLDPYICPQLDTNLVDELQQLSTELVARLTESLNSRGDEVPTLRSQLSTSDEDIDSDVLSAYINSSYSSMSPDSDSSRTNDSNHQETETGLDHSVGTLAPSINSSYRRAQDLVLTHRVQLLASYNQVKQPYRIFESLLKCANINQAILKACRIVSQNLGAALVYVAEDQQARPRLVEHYKQRSKLTTDEALKVFNTESELIQRAIESQYGIQHSHADDYSDLLKSGIYIPFRKLDSNTNNQGSLVIAALVDNHREFSPGDAEFVKKVSKALENIILCHDKVNKGSSQ